MLWYQLLRPFSYIVIHHPVKKKVDWFLPLIMTVVALVAIYPVRGQLNLWGDGGLFHSLQNVLQGLPGFFIAALAVVATFGQKGTLDTLIPEPTPTLETNYGGTWVSMQLTRRRFLCLLFAYLTVVSLLLSLIAPYIRMMARPLRELLIPWIANALSLLATSLYLLFMFQLLFVTFWGLYYLSDRMLQPDGPVGSVSQTSGPEQDT